MAANTTSGKAAVEKFGKLVEDVEAGNTTAAQASTKATELLTAVEKERTGA